MVISLNFPLARKISKKEVEKTARKRRDSLSNEHSYAVV